MGTGASGCFHSGHGPACGARGERFAVEEPPSRQQTRVPVLRKAHGAKRRPRVGLRLARCSLRKGLIGSLCSTDARGHLAERVFTLVLASERKLPSQDARPKTQDLTWPLAGELGHLRCSKTSGHLFRSISFPGGTRGAGATGWGRRGWRSVTHLRCSSNLPLHRSAHPCGSSGLVVRKRNLTAWARPDRPVSRRGGTCRSRRRWAGTLPPGPRCSWAGFPAPGPRPSSRR